MQAKGVPPLSDGRDDNSCEGRLLPRRLKDQLGRYAWQV